VHVVLLARSAHDDVLRGRARLDAQSALAREALEQSARASGAALGPLEKDAEEAPLPTNGWHWSLSHAAGFAAGAVCRARIGIDVEAVAPRRSDVVARVSSREELDLLGGFSWEAFVRVWTAKEAVLKKAGVGLLELDRCRVVAVPGRRTLVVNHRGRDHVVEQRMECEHVAAVTHDDVDRIVHWTWSPAAVAHDRGASK
jgi:4'-phosphopantetheinyl transferase